MNDLITISVPTYRRPTSLLHCLHSCLTQDYRPLEIDVSDNSHTDETGALVESIPVPSGITVRYWRNSPSIGPVQNHKKLLEEARGDRFLWMHDDDVLRPGAVAAMADAFNLASDVIISYGREQIINMAGELLPEQTARINKEQSRLSEFTGLRRDLLLCAFLGHVPHVSFLVRTDVARTVGIRDRSEIGLAVDADFVIRIGRAYKGFAHVFLDHDTLQSRVGASTLGQTSGDVVSKLYDFIRNMDDLTPEEADARDRSVAKLELRALREHSIANGRQAALRIFWSRPHRSDDSLAQWLFCVALILMPDLAYRLHEAAKARLGEQNWLYNALRPKPRPV